MKAKGAMQGLALVGIFVFGISELAQGAYIYTKAQVAQFLLRDAWQQTLRARKLGVETPVKAWSWADTWPVARLVFPASEAKSGTTLLVLSGASLRTLAFGPGHLQRDRQGGGYPGGAGNTVIVGHRDTHFQVLRDIEVNQNIVLETSRGERINYVVESLNVVHESQTEILQHSDQPVLTLITCYPFDALTPGGPLRYVVVARPA